jgi:peptide/nickel transport system substrate-binding protein
VSLSSAILVVLCALTAGTATVGANAGAATTTTTTTPTVTYVPVAGGSISFGMTQSPTGCNPHTPSGASPATEMLLGAVLPSPYIEGASGSIVPNPNLTAGAELVSTKPETIVYTLNPKAVWSDGVPITAKDFIYAWEQQRGDPSSDPTAVASTAGYRDIRSIKGSNKGRTVTVVFRRPFGDWEMLFGDLLPAHIMEKTGWNPTCATVDKAIDLSGGPFRIASASAQTVVLRANPKWWGTRPNSRTITVHIASSSAQLAQWVRSNYVQVAVPSTITPAFLDDVTSLPHVQSEVSLSGTTLQLEMASGPNTKLSPDMRFALALSVDRQALVTKAADWALSSVQVGTSHIYAQGQSGYHSSPLTSPTTTVPTVPTTSTSTSTTVIGAGGAINFPTRPSPTQASALMTASGYARTAPGTWHNDFGLALTIHLVVDDGDPWAVAAAPILQGQLEAAGFAVALTNTPSEAAAGATLAAGSTDLALLPLTSSPFLSQSLAWYTTLLGSAGQDGSQDWTGYDNRAFNSLLTKASRQLGPTAAGIDYAAADVQLWDDVVTLPLFTEPSAMVWSRKIAGVQPVPSGPSLLWYAQFWAVRVAESTASTTPPLPNT